MLLTPKTSKQANISFLKMFRLYGQYHLHNNVHMTKLRSLTRSFLQDVPLFWKSCKSLFTEYYHFSDIS